MRRICELGLIRAQAFSAQGRLREAGDIYSSLQRTLNEAGADMIVKYGVAYGRFLLAQGDYLTAVTVLEQALQSTGISHEDMSTVYLLLSEAFTMTGDDGQHRFLICLRGNTRGREHNLFYTGGGKGVFRQFRQFG